MGADVESFACDVTKRAEVDTAMAATLERFGRVDACFANAGGGGFRGASHMTDNATWQDTIDLNITSVVNTWSAVTNHMMARGSGKLIVTSSAAALMGTAGAAGYSTTKAAVVGLTQALAVELGQANIQVNAILPGFVETEMSLTTSDEFQAAARRRSVLGRIGTFEDMEGIAVFLASKHSDYLTGQGIVIDGGHTIFPI